MSGIFQRAIVLALAAPAAAACSSTSASTPDATTAQDSTTGDLGVESGDDAMDAGETSPSGDAAFWADGCAPVIVQDADDCIPDYTMPCGAPDGYPNGTHAIEDCWDLCPPSPDGGSLAFTCSTNDVLLVCTYCTVGRRPSGWRSDADAEKNPPIDRWLTNVAALEAASVFAFSHLRHELRMHGAPRSLLRSISRARRDEIRHARAMRAQAHRHGGRSKAILVAPKSPRSLEEIAIENAIEGGVRETFGAALATLQSMRTADRDLATTLTRIASEETEHAALSRRVARWISPRLSSIARRRVTEARRRAALALRAEIATSWPTTLADAGMPTREEALALFDATAAILIER